MLDQYTGHGPIGINNNINNDMNEPPLSIKIVIIAVKY